ncbi:hypothetical protein [Beduini massiliensis]|uniref:hypothetical protein n=1 Tax=Beduini massiliensis TaxID=1585974 RepID=UPI00059AAD8C|nr:hypothetical protein [Beduini massiliensis]
MYKIDSFSYQCGIMDCFNEMVKAGLKPMALAHPFKTPQEREVFIPFVNQITKQYENYYYLDNDPLITDLFAASLNLNTYNIIFYRDEAAIEKYKELKEAKKQAIANKHYQEVRENIAYKFGRLLGYPDSHIQRYIENNNEKEEY